MADDPSPPSAPPGRVPRLVGDFGALVLGGVLVVALYGKMLDPSAFVELVAHEGLDFLLPATWVAAIGLGLEAALGFALLFLLRRWVVLVPAAALVAFFVFLTARTYYLHTTGQHEATGSCGCFGNIVERSPAEAFWTDLFLLVPPLLMAFVGVPRGPLRAERLRWALTGGLTLATLAFAWFAPDLPLDDLATRLRPGAEAADLCAGQDDARVCLRDVVPELAEGRHVVVLADLADEAFLARVPDFNAYALDAGGPPLWVLTSAPAEDVDMFMLTSMPAFTVVPCPAGVMRPLYRRLPRSFLGEAGVVRQTWSGWPPLDDLAAAAGDDGGDPDDGDLPDPGSGPGDSGDDDPDPGR